MTRSVYGNTATEITGGVLSALISALLMLLTNGLIEELAVLLLLHALAHYGQGYPWRRCLYNNGHLARDSAWETLGGVGQSTGSVCNCLFLECPKFRAINTRKREISKDSVQIPPQEQVLNAGAFILKKCFWELKDCIA